MPKPCLGRIDLENYRAGAAKVFSQSFFYTASEWIQSGLFKIRFNNGMFCSHCHNLAQWMNLFKGTLYDFNYVTHDFLRQHVF